VQIAIPNVRFPPIADIRAFPENREMSFRELLWMLLPHRRTTPEEARQAILRSGISPDDIEWRVGKDGSFAFGRKQEGQPLTYEQASKLLSWARKFPSRRGDVSSFAGKGKPANAL